ncbi:MAG: radical SAM protein [Elusimicrobiota bacterium]|nr:radical SAM protein [Elusimicrobiota bacterium]
MRCVYCHQPAPSGVAGAKMLQWGDFTNIIAQIQDLYQGERMLQPKIAEMVDYMVKARISDRYEITTNGVLLTDELSRNLVDAGLTRIIISVQGVTAKKYKEICGTEVDVSELRDKVNRFFSYAKERKTCQVLVKTVDVALDEGEIEKFHKLFEGCCDATNVESLIKVSDELKWDKFDRF